jgi:hypothetical protein
VSVREEGRRATGPVTSLPRSRLCSTPVSSISRLPSSGIGLLVSLPRFSASSSGSPERPLPLPGAEALAKDACLDDYDFRYRGVIPILVGFTSGTSSSSTPLTQPHHSPGASPRTIYSDITRSLRRGDEAQTKNAAYSAAASTLVARKKIDGTFSISSSSFGAQRKLALQSCGLDWEEDYEVVCTRCVAFSFSYIS